MACSPEPEMGMQKNNTKTHWNFLSFYCVTQRRVVLLEQLILRTDGEGNVQRTANLVSMDQRPEG